MAEVTYDSAHPIRLLGLGVSHAAADDAVKDPTPEPTWKELELQFEPWEDEDAML
jgi:hypothetical protein